MWTYKGLIRKRASITGAHIFFFKIRNFYNGYNEEIIIYKKDQWDKTYGGIYTQMDRW